MILAGCANSQSITESKGEISPNRCEYKDKRYDRCSGHDYKYEDDDIERFITRNCFWNQERGRIVEGKCEEIVDTYNRDNGRKTDSKRKTSDIFKREKGRTCLSRHENGILEFCHNGKSFAHDRPNGNRLPRRLGPGGECKSRGDFQTCRNGAFYSARHNQLKDIKLSDAIIKKYLSKGSEALRPIDGDQIEITGAFVTNNGSDASIEDVLSETFEYDFNAITGVLEIAENGMGKSHCDTMNTSKGCLEPGSMTIGVPRDVFDVIQEGIDLGGGGGDGLKPDGVPGEDGELDDLEEEERKKCMRGLVSAHCLIYIPNAVVDRFKDVDPKKITIPVPGKLIPEDDKLKGIDEEGVVKVHPDELMS
tara:strand:+ start:133058 stop:134149 length:1092 start_codon:yes stop_codon:yes gene_type:complete